MSATELTGPLLVRGANPRVLGPVGYTGAQPAIVGDSNPDLSPSMFWGGVGLPDPEFTQNVSGRALVAGGYPDQAVGWYMPRGIMAIDQVPVTISNTIFAALQAPTSGTPLTLAAGIAAAFTVLPTGLVVPVGAVVIDSAPVWAGSGASGGFAWFDPTKGISRAISLTSAANLSAINFTIRGYDIYGYPQSEVIAGPNANTVNTLKTFKWLVSVTPNGTSVSTLSVGNADIFGFPIRANTFDQTDIWWNETVITANTGFVAADTTSPATTSTGDVRGTYATASASDSAKKLKIYVTPNLAAVIGSTNAAMRTGLKGTVPV